LKRVAFLISGGGSNMVALVRMLQDTGLGTPVLVFSNRPNAVGLQKAVEMGVPTAFEDHTKFGGDRRAFEQAMDVHLRAAKPDLICHAGFMRILTPDCVAGWSGQMMNIHPSLLPKYPGLNTHARAIAAGDRVAGCSVHWVTEDLDAGPLIGQARVPVEQKDTPEALAERVLVAEHMLYPACLQHVLSGQTGKILL